MSTYDPDILGVFLVEARERLEKFQSGMLYLESHPNDAETVHALFREMHTIKGGARYLDCAPISDLCHAAEDFLDDFRNGRGQLSRNVANLLLATVDHLNASFVHLERQEAVPPDFAGDLVTKLKSLNGLGDDPHALVGEDSVATALLQAVRENSATIRNKLEGLADPMARDVAHQHIGEAVDALKNACEYANNDEGLALAQSLSLALASASPGTRTVVEKARILSELDRLGRAVKPKPTGNTGLIQRPPAAQPIPGEVHPHATENANVAGTTLRVEQAKIDHGISLAGELSIMRSSLRHAVRQIARDPTNLTPIFEAADVLDRIANDIEDHALGLRRVAMRHCFGRFPRVIRDLSLALDKEIELVVDGDGIEVDKTVVETLSEPLVHVLRNACDHGLEATAERQRLGKSKAGKITVTAAYEGKQVVIEIGDDGGGIPVAKVAAKAVSLGLITNEAVARMTADEQAQLVFLPGLSTAEKITDVSGRGVGMDVVKRTVDGLGGQIHISTKPGTGTTFRIVLPPASFTLSCTSSVLVRVGEAIYGLPMESVHETVKAPLDDIQNLGGQTAICLRGDVVPIRTLASLLAVSDAQRGGGRDNLRQVVREGQVSIAILTTPQGLLGLAVDQLIGQQGLVVKPLPALFGHLPGISGASILADGGILLMIDSHSIIQAAAHVTATPGKT